MLAGRTVRVTDASVDDVERVLQDAGVAAHVTVVPSTLDETLIGLSRA
jgi:hypothetical protein